MPNENLSELNKSEQPNSVEGLELKSSVTPELGYGSLEKVIPSETLKEIQERGPNPSEAAVIEELRNNELAPDPQQNAEHVAAMDENAKRTELLLDYLNGNGRSDFEKMQEEIFDSTQI